MTETNEIQEAARAAKRSREAAEANRRKADKWPVGPVAIGIGIGSAALAAAVLFVSQKRR